MTKGEIQAILFIATSLLIGAVVLLVNRYDPGILPDLVTAEEAVISDPIAPSPATAGNAAGFPDTPLAERTGGRPDIAPDSGDLIVPINTATAAELQRLPGIGPTLADRIIAFRQKAGAFVAIEQMLEIKGIGPARLDRLRPYVVLR